MLPVVKGEAATRRQIVAYALVLVAFTLIPVATGFLGALYLAAALVLGGGFVALAVRLLRTRSRRAALRLYLLARVPRPALLRDGPGPGHLIEPRPWIAAERPATSERGF